MLYRFLKTLFRFALRIFFRNLQVKGLDKIPAEGPLLLISNHPNTLFDPLVIATSIRREVYFLAKGVAFQSPFARWLLPKLNLIPLHRAQDDPAMMEQNETSFRLCYDHLARGGALLIFPEGVSLNERRLRKIKTGAARIALGAEAASDFRLGIHITCVGLTYSSHHRFRSSVFMHVAEPIRVSDLAQNYREDPVAAVTMLTAAIRERLRSLFVDIEDEVTDRFVAQIEAVYKSHLLQDLGYSPAMRDKDFMVTQAIHEAVRYYLSEDPARAEHFQDSLDRYFFALRRLQLKDRVLKRLAGRGQHFVRIAAETVFLLLGFPVFAFGAVLNYLPFKIPEWIARRIIPSREFLGSVTLLLGIVCFALYYSLLLAVCWHLTHRLGWVVLALAALPITGIFAYAWYRTASLLLGKWKTALLFVRRKPVMDAIVAMRTSILDELEKARSEYLAGRSGDASF